MVEVELKYKSQELRDKLGIGRRGHRGRRGPERESPASCEAGLSPVSTREAVLRDGADVRRLQALGALVDVELHLLPLGEAAEPFGLDGGVVTEDVAAAAVLGDEAEALRVVEPLHGASCHVLCARFFTVYGRRECHPAQLGARWDASI